MEANTQEHMQHLVETLRATGYYGRDSALAQAPLDVGTRIAASRQLEIIATHIAVAWLDVPDAELWDDFIQISFVPQLFALATIIDHCLEQCPSSRGLETFQEAWKGTRLLVGTTNDNAVREADRNACVVTLFIAAMVLRQAAECELAPVNARAAFSPSSTNVAPEFYARCLSELGFPPSDDAFFARDPLEKMSRLVAQASYNLSSRATASVRQRSA